MTPKQIAINNGEKYYMTGKPCKRNHISLRLVSSNDCLECSRLRQKSDKVKKYKNNHYFINSEKYKKAANNNYEINKESKKTYASEYQKKNLKKIVFNRKQRALTDFEYASKEKIRCLLRASFKSMSYRKESKTFQIIGCSSQIFKIHIEKQFLKGMSWGNNGDWHIDHIVPVSSSTDLNDFLKLNHFSNLRPLWAKDNLEKSNKLIFLI